MTQFQFRLNGETVTVADVAPTVPLLDFLRSIGRTGSKLGCGEGDCGACTAAVVERNGAGAATYRAFNSCIAPVALFANREVVTVEGIARGGVLHPVQAAMVDRGGSQCGFCTPGFVVSLFEGYYRADCAGAGAINAQLCGNLCRCTGYRPIRDAAAAAYGERSPQLLAADPFAGRLAEPVGEAPGISYTAAGGTFVRPTSLSDLLALRRQHVDAVLIAGATELGVDLNKKFRSLPMLVALDGVPELTGVNRTPTGWRIGAAATLTTVEEVLAGEYPALTQMFAVFAARQIRNRATLGGNLVTASPIGDSAPVLLALDASVVLASDGGERLLPLDAFFAGYRRTALAAGEVLREILLPAARPNTRSAFYKVSHRRELDISIAAAAFRLDEDAEGTVRAARIAYGGMAAMTMRVPEAEQALIGRTLAQADADVRAILARTFQPIDDVRAGVAYRRGLAVGLWEKFVAGDAPELSGAQPPWVASSGLHPADASRDLRHESAVGHVTGAAQYVDDLARQRPALEVWPVCAPHAHARIKRRDAARARSAPGIAAVLLAEDVPGENNVGPSRHDEPLLASDEIRYHGQIVALVVGATAAECRTAAALVEVEYEPLPPVVGLPAAIAANRYLTEPRCLVRGDAAAALVAAPHQLGGTFSLGGQEHFYLETQAAWAERGDEGDVFVCSSTQHPSEIQAIVAEVLGLAKHQVVVQAPRMGGGFGGKETQGNSPAALVALAAFRTGRPVRVQWDRDLDFTLTGKRHPFQAEFRVGFDSEGRLLAAEVTLVSDGGWSLDLSQPVLDRALFHLDNAYYVPAVRFTGRVAQTNVTSQTAFRGFGGPQGMLVMEEMVDRVARELGLPPEVVRERNLYRGRGETNTTHYGEEIGDNRLREMWTLALAQAEFGARRSALGQWNLQHPRRRRGLAVTPVKFGISFTLTHYNQAGALVLIFDDGTVQVNHGGTEMGQGLHTKIKGIAMRELGIPAASVRMMRTSTDKVPNTSATAASSGADLNGAAVRAACVTLRERLAPVAAKLFADARGIEVAPEDVVFAGGRVFARLHPETAFDFAQICHQATLDRVSLSSTGYYRTPNIHWDWKTASGRPFAYFACGVAVAEVEVDSCTGMSRVLRVDVVHDVGDSLNPGVDRGQIEGGFVQGMGWLTSEELKWDLGGRLLTHGASTYQIPAISDAPVEFNVTLLPRATQENTIHGSKAVGEPPLMLAFSVREAIRDAISSYGPPGGQVPLPSPATGEAIFAAIAARLERP